MILILGGGLAGLSAAYHLGDVPHRVFEASASPGGLARTRKVGGYLFDYAGHLLHLRDPRAIELVEGLLPDGFGTVERRARVMMQGVTLPYPVQANLHGLPRPMVAECIIDFVEAMSMPPPDDVAVSFAEWSVAVFGRGICDAFMFPYNTKLFGRHPEDMTADWVSWAVPRPSLEQVVCGALGLTNEHMGYNPTFRYPREGGIGVVPAALAERVEHLQLGMAAVAVDLDRRVVVLEDASEHTYDQLVVTVPLNRFLKMLVGGPDRLGERAYVAAEKLDWSVVACVNLGIRQAEVADGAHWVYTPDSDIPFYRAGFPTNFSRTVAPAGCSSAYVEFGLGRRAVPSSADLERAAIAGLQKLGILDDTVDIEASDTIVIDPGYVVFDWDRQAVVAEMVPALRKHDVQLIGRYGAWTYASMERALLDGMEVAERLKR